MSHIHVPDGVLPFWLCFCAYLIIFIYLIIFSFNFKKMELNKKIPLVGVMSALMLVTMSLELPIGYHVNLAALSGILLGPWLAILSIFIVNIILAFLGHGGVTVIGLNTIVVSIEAVLAYFIFKGMMRWSRKTFRSVFLATFIALFVSAWSTIGLVYLGTNNTNYLRYDDDKAGKVHHVQKAANNDVLDFNIKKFIFLILVLGLVGWSLESLITAFIVSYISRTKPEILENSVGHELYTSEQE